MALVEGNNSSALFIRIQGPQTAPPEFLIAVPLKGANRAGGFVVSTFALQTALAPVLAEVNARGYDIAIFDEDQTLYHDAGLDGRRDRAWGQQTPIQVGTSIWQVRLWPQTGRLAKARSDLPETALAVGFLIGFLVLLVLQLNHAGRKHAAALEQMHHDLQDETSARKLAHEALENQARELSRSNEELQQFAYVASHDLQEPLRMVVSYMQLIERRYKDKLDESGREFIDFAVDGASRMQELIQSLLTYSRVGTKGNPFAPTELTKVLERAQFNLRMAIDEASATITHDALPEIQGDAIQLVQLFQNLLGNAIKFRGAAPTTVHISVTEQEHDWLFSVRDSGIGFDPQYAERIFIIFQRLQGRDEYPGTGIGLAVCKKIVQRHGGDIWAESQIGQGAIFRFTIPKLNKDPSHE
jgi:signal transduction histidine kinase